MASVEAATMACFLAYKNSFLSCVRASPSGAFLFYSKKVARMVDGNAIIERVGEVKEWSVAKAVQ